MPGSITSMSKETTRRGLAAINARWQLPLTVHRVVSYSLLDLLHDALPPDVLDLVGMRDHEADFIIVVVVLPAVQCAANADMLTEEEKLIRVDTGRVCHEGAYNIGVIRGEQALVGGIPEVASVTDRYLLRQESAWDITSVCDEAADFSRQPRAIFLCVCKSNCLLPACEQLLTICFGFHVSMTHVSFARMV